MVTHKLTDNSNKNKFQFTFFSEHYKPVACIILTEKNFVEVVKNERDFVKMAIVKVCQKRGWTKKEFTDFGYGTYKFRRVKEE